MGMESDAYDTTVSVIKVWETQNFPTAFGSVPIVVTLSTTDKKKSGVDNRTATDFDISCETTGVMVFAREAGYDAGSAGNWPESDAGTETISVAKAFQSFTFGGTFATAPSVIVGYGDGTVAGGKKISCKSIRTTGGDIVNETTEGVQWIAVIKGGMNLA